MLNYMKKQELTPRGTSAWWLGDLPMTAFWFSFRCFCFLKCPKTLI